MDVSIKVTRIKDKFHARLLKGDEVLDEMACVSTEDISWICREMLRWYSKTGGVSAFAEAARDRQNSSKPLVGKIFYIKRIANV